MSMGGIFHDTVASVRCPNEIKTLLVVMAILAGVHPCVGMTGASSPGPKSTTDRAMFATEGQPAGPSSTDDKDMMTTNQMDPAVSTKNGNILLIIAVAGSIIVVIVIVVAIATAELLVRKYKQDIAESNNQMYCTMSRDPNTDNNYTELDHGHTGEKFPTSLSVNTEESPAYYNTAPADSQYENPPASTE